ncbi:hypothetical protein HPB51_026953 [Rhipicephalus microplus]|uniref:RING-CH-type domain-containing protein n=1 Tax=Rhipicephalus microplus TaxID=6941 RepID=A0A9J6D1U2_RHIMP|nr:hypothetical protein HPB51_026953 [Rhipicephalus microplus]
MRRRRVTCQKLTVGIESSLSHNPHGYIMSVNWSPPRYNAPLRKQTRFSGSPPGSSTGCLNVTASSAPICCICHEGDQTDCLMSLCKCSSNMGLLHILYLEHSLNAQNVDHCEFFHHRFPTVAQATGILQLFYWALRADSLWVVLGDLLSFSVMAPLTTLSCF